jgi:hypothetical protein
MNKIDKRIADLPERLSRLLERIDDLNAKWLVNNSIAESMILAQNVTKDTARNSGTASETLAMDFPIDKDAVYADNA